MKKKMLMLATTAAMIEQFNKNNILILEEMGYEVHVAGNFLVGNPISEEKLEEFKVWLEEHHGKWFHITATRKPTDMKNNVFAYKKVVELITEYKYEFIHCHTPIGSVIGRIAAHVTHTKIIYTAHGFHFFKGAPLINWLLYYPVERFLSRWTDVLILINQEDYQRAKNTFHAKRTEYIPGIGIDLEKFKNGNIDCEKLREKLGLKEDDVMLFSVGELNKNKNHEVVIRAVAKLNNSKLHYFIAGQGNLKEYLQNLASELGVDKQVHLLGYRDDVIELLKISDLFLFPSRREGLGIAAIEAMASGLPLITSNRHGINDYSQNDITGYKCSPDDIDGFAEAIAKLIGSPALREKISIHNLNLVKKYSLIQIEEYMKKIYSDISEIIIYT